MTEEERTELESRVEGDGFRQLLQTIGGKEPKHVELLDAAYWMKGCSSLGNLRFALLMGIGSKKHPEYRLLDIKEATLAVPPSAKGANMPEGHADRVVAGACALSPFLGERMLAATICHRPVVVRELRPQDLKFELVGLAQSEAIAIARLMAGVVGRAHGRQLKREERSAWSHNLKSRHRKGFDARDGYGVGSWILPHSTRRRTWTTAVVTPCDRGWPEIAVEQSDLAIRLAANLLLDGRFSI